MVRATGALLLFVATATAADAPPRPAAVRATGAELRGGKSSIFPVTGYLRPGQFVWVVREEDKDWLAIVPPADQSCWLPDRLLNFDPPPTPGRPAIGVVLADDTPALLGTADKNGPHPIRVASPKRGTLIVATGDSVLADVTGDTGLWWRVRPVPGEVRYVARGNVDFAVGPGGSPAPAELPIESPRFLWQQAEKAEKAGDLTRAELLYRRIAGDQSRPDGDHDLAAKCHAKLTELGSRRNSEPTPAYTTARTTPAGGGPAVEKGTIPFATSGPGYLRKTGFKIDGNAAYVVEDEKGQPRAYAVPAPGLNMMPYLNRRVELIGTYYYRADLGIGGYLAVGQIKPR